MKRMSIVVIVLIVALVGVSVASAAGPRGRGGLRAGGQIFDIISDATGLDFIALHEALSEDGATLASVIEANGGDVEAVQAQIVETIVENTGLDAEDVEAHVSDILNTPRPNNFAYRPMLGDGFGPRGQFGGRFGANHGRFGLGGQRGNFGPGFFGPRFVPPDGIT